MNLSTISEQLKDIVAVGGALTVLVLFAVSSPTGDFVSSPPYWVDEAITVAKARGLLTYGALDVAVAPDTLSGKPYATAAAGPLVSIPLAGFFALFGIGVEHVRVYMLLWLILLIVVAYLFIRRIAGRREAIYAVLLIATFSPLYANGKTATGDVPGFVALVIALYCLYEKKWYLFSGVLLGIASTTKPSLFLFVIGVAVVELLVSERDNRIRHAISVTAGFFIVLVPWVLSLSPRAASSSSWHAVYAFFRNPFPEGAVSLLEQTQSGAMGFLLHTTVLHFAAFMIVAALAVWYTRKRDDTEVRFLRFGMFYALMAFYLYLRSPGWLRYLLAAELLLFLGAPSAIFLVRRALRETIHVPVWGNHALLLACIAAQSIHIAFFSWRPASDVSMRDAIHLQIIMQPEETVGVIGAPAVSSLLDPRRTYQVIRISGNTVIGKSPLAYGEDTLPTYLYLGKSRFSTLEIDEFVEPYRSVLETRYQMIHSVSGASLLYKKR